MPHSMFDVQQLNTMRGQPVYGADGEELGHLEEVYFDESTQQPEWISVKNPTLGGLLGAKHYMVPVAEAQLLVEGRQEPAIMVPYSKDKVKDAPQIDGDYIPETQEDEAYAFYGLQPPEMRTETRISDGEDPKGMSADMSVSRHEEELRVGKRETESGRVRLRKWVETEPVSEDVELRRETARIERQQVNRPVSGNEMGEVEAEMRLHREEPVVSKETVEKERITVQPEVEIEHETVHGEVRREQVDIEDESVDSQRDRERLETHEGPHGSPERH